MPNFVQEYRSTDQGSWPSLTGQAGSLIALLDAILVNGGTTISVTSLTESGTTVTAVISADTTLETNDYLTIAGASPSGANGTFQITVTDSTHFTYQAAAGLGTITGTITYKRAPLGWTKALSGTNLAAYLPQATATTGFPQFYLRIDETGGSAGGQKEVSVRGYETMSDVNTGTNLFPTAAQQAGGLCWRKSATADATSRSWYLIGDGATFYFIPNSDASTTLGRGLYGFGGFISYKPSDAYNAFIGAFSTFNSTNSGSTGFGSCASVTAGFVALAGACIARPYTLIAGSVGVSCINKWSTSGSTSVLGTFGQLAAPNAPDGSYWFDTLQFHEATAVLRGRPRGLYTHAHTASPFASEFDSATSIAGLSGITLINVLIAASSSAGNAQFDKFGPW